MARILIAIDFSEAGHAALEAGIALAMDLKQDVRLVHAFPKLMQAPVAAGIGYQEVFQRFAAEHEAEEAIRLTTEFADKARATGLDVDILARGEDPATLILEAADADDVDMVVMGTHGKRGFRRLVLGSVAQGVVAKSRTPVLVVPKP